jgi:hypothetical protein
MSHLHDGTTLELKGGGAVKPMTTKSEAGAYAKQAKGLRGLQARHSALVAARAQARKQFPPGHPVRLKAEKAVRKSQARIRQSPGSDEPNAREIAAGKISAKTRKLQSAGASSGT